MATMHRWESPHQWARNKLLNTNDPAILRGYANALLLHLDADQVQNLFQREMDEDGYFKKMAQCPRGRDHDYHIAGCEECDHAPRHFRTSSATQRGSTARPANQRRRADDYYPTPRHAVQLH